MLWNKKYKYPTSRRKIIDGKRHYEINNEKLPSCTEILNATMPIEKKEKLNQWVEKVGKKESQIIAQRAAHRGTKLHKYLEDYLNNKLNLNLFEDNSREFLMAQQIIENGLKNKLNEIWGIEENLYFPNKFGGAADLIAGDYEGNSAILDFKSSSKARQDSWNEDYYLQVSGYISAHNEVYGTSIDKGVILICTEDNFFQRFIIEGDRLQKYKQMFFERVEQYYSQIKK